MHACCVKHTKHFTHRSLGNQKTTILEDNNIKLLFSNYIKSVLFWKLKEIKASTQSR